MRRQQTRTVLAPRLVLRVVLRPLSLGEHGLRELCGLECVVIALRWGREVEREGVGKCVGHRNSSTRSSTSKINVAERQGGGVRCTGRGGGGGVRVTLREKCESSRVED